MIIDEQFFQFLWRDQLLDLKNLTTTTGKRVRICDPGTQNLYDGPDFLNAKIEINGLEFHGNIELHIKSSFWNVHGHQFDRKYDNVILHVVINHDKEVLTKSGRELETIELKDKVNSRYFHSFKSGSLTKNKDSCADVIQQMTSLKRLSFFDNLYIERLKEKVDHLSSVKIKRNYCWSKVLLYAFSKQLAYGNKEAMEDWIDHINIRDLLQIRLDKIKVASYLFGVSGLLDNIDKVDDYQMELVHSYRHVKVKYQLREMDNSIWNKGRIRMYSHPVRIIGFLSEFVSKRLHDWQFVLDDFTIQKVNQILDDSDTKYWAEHFQFGRRLPNSNRYFNKSRKELLLVNVFIPLYIAILRDKSSSDILEQLMTLKPEINNTIKAWKERGVKIDSLWDSQAILQLDKQYCSRNKCLSCRIGRSILKDAKIDYQNKKANGSPILWGLSVVG